MGGLSPEEIDRMRQEDKAYAEQDQKPKALVELKNQVSADSEITAEEMKRKLLEIAASVYQNSNEVEDFTADMGGLSPEEIDRMRQEAEVYEEIEGEHKVLKGMREQADTLLYIYEATIGGNSELISEALKTKSASRVAELKSAIANPATTVDEMQQQLDSFQQFLFDMGVFFFPSLSPLDVDDSDIFDDESDVDDDDFTGGVAPVPRPWKPTPPPLMDGEAVD
jgi:molecular chaperone DnaK (HSP70)